MTIAMRDDIAAPATGPPDLAPEAEDLARRHDDTVERGGGPAQILHLAQLIRPLVGPLVRPQRRARLSDDERKPGAICCRETAQTGESVTEAARRLMQHHLGAEQRD